MPFRRAGLQSLCENFDFHTVPFYVREVTAYARTKAFSANLVEIAFSVVCSHTLQPDRNGSPPKWTVALSEGRVVPRGGTG